MQTFTTREVEIATAGGILGGLAVTMLVLYIITIIAGWRIFEKAGEKGWKSLIPIYNFYVLYKIVGMKNWFWWTIIFSFAVSIVYSACGFDYNAITSVEAFAKIDWSQNIIPLIALIADAVFSLVVAILYARNTAKAFGKGTGFAICMFFFTPICWLVLGYGKAKYNKKALKK